MFGSEKAAPSIALPPLPPSIIAPSPTASSFAASQLFARPSPVRSKQLPPVISEHVSDVWRTLDVRAMVLLSLLSHIVLFVLGKRRKHSVSFINKSILWLAYQSKDWISIATLGKLSNLGPSIDEALGKLSNSTGDWVNVKALPKQSKRPPPPPPPESQEDNSYPEEISNIFTALWTPLLILNLGGPDTITAYSVQDIQLWARHLVTLVFQCFLAFCDIIWSVNQSFLPVFSTLLYFVGICKHIESILCLKTKQLIPEFKNPGLQSHPLIENQESKKVLLGYILFTAIRPDVNDYLCYKEYPLSFKARMRTYLTKANNQVKSILQGLLGSDELRSGNHLTHFDIAVVELGFIFDVVYTKAPLIYTWKGCILRLISLTLSIGILFFFIFQISFGGLNLHLIAPDDVFLTMSLLVETVALEICAVLSNLCSDWALISLYDNYSGRKILRYILQFFPCFLSQQKRQSAWMGQFDLLDYCWDSRMAGVYRFLQKYRGRGSGILENCHRSKHTKFVEVPSCLKPKEVYQSRLDSFFVTRDSSGATRWGRTLVEGSSGATSGERTLVEGSSGATRGERTPVEDSFEATRGERTLGELEERISDIRADLEFSIKIHFDASIIAWHLATCICYHQDSGDPNNARNEAMKISKYISDYMMYLLVMRPAMLLPDDCASSLLDRAPRELTDLISEASSLDAAVDSLLRNPPEISDENAVENLPKYAVYLATKLNRSIDKWELIKAMWIEMLLYAAHSDLRINHVRQLGEYGREFISIIWVMGSYRVIQEEIEKVCRKGELPL